MGAMDSETSHTVAWQSPGAWQQVTLFFSSLISGENAPDLSIARQVARGILADYETLEERLDVLAARVCPDCRDNCCARAVIGYDFPDLLFQSLVYGDLPPAQMTKVQDPQAGRICACLSPTGCRLPRARRPFVCTWYLCPPMKALDTKGDLAATVEGIKKVRKRMEAELYAVLSGKPVIY